MKPLIFIFGAAEKGEFCTPYLCKTLLQLADTFGNPPSETEGLVYAIQSILYDQELIYFRVEEEGFSFSDYFFGIDLLKKKKIPLPVSAICLPGVGNPEIIESCKSICLFINEKDFYDYLTSK